LKRGVLNGRSTALLEPERVTLPGFLQSLGYATAGIGKWHLGLGADPAPDDGEHGRTDYDAPLRPGPVSAGFEHYFGIPASLDMEPYLYIEDAGVFEEATETVEASAMRRYGGDGYWRAGDIAPGFDFLQVTPTLFDRAGGYLEQRAAAGDDRAGRRHPGPGPRRQRLGARRRLGRALASAAVPGRRPAGHDRPGVRGERFGVGGTARPNR